VPEARYGEAVMTVVLARDVASGSASGGVRGTPTLFIDGMVSRRGYDVAALSQVLGRMSAPSALFGAPPAFGRWGNQRRV
jgi:hypothetical protein